jgi:hypothetical protein
MSKQSKLRIKADPRYVSPAARAHKRLFKGIAGGMSWAKLNQVQAKQLAELAKARMKPDGTKKEPDL